MRKLALLMAVALVVTFAAPVMAKPVEIERDNWLVLQVPSMEAFAYESDSERTIDISDYYGELDCPGAPNGWVYINGWSNTLDAFRVSPTKGKHKFTSGYAHATVQEGTYSYEDCDGNQVVDGDLAAKGATITMELDGTGGSLVRSKWVDRDNWLPPASMWRERSHSLMRTATAIVTVSVDDWSYVWSGDGAIGKARWKWLSKEP